jgi:predicted nucleotidyltransferase component of viral defense system
VIFNFVESINAVSDDFVLKGGNLLWLYIQTPRATVDLDFSTLRKRTHTEVKKALSDACAHTIEGITFSIAKFEEVRQQSEMGAAVVVKYRTDQGAANEFGLDIVYGIPTDHSEISSPVHGEPKIQAATIENIIADKLAAVHRFKGGNTRMKDYDDLWRLQAAKQSVERKTLLALFKDREIKPQLDPAWIGPDIEKLWASHRKRYTDLPEDLADAFGTINAWLTGLIHD